MISIACSYVQLLDTLISVGMISRLWLQPVHHLIANNLMGKSLAMLVQHATRCCPCESRDYTQFHPSIVLSKKPAAYLFGIRTYAYILDLGDGNAQRFEMLAREEFSTATE